MLSTALLSCKQQIVFAYEELSLSPEEISSQFNDYGFSSEDIQTLLVDHSPKYRLSLESRSKEATSGKSSAEDLETLLLEYRHLSRSSDNDLVKERALKFLIQEKKGRNDLPERTLKLKERQVGAQEADTAIRAQSFISAMKEINNKLKGVLQSPKPVLELKNNMTQ